MSEKRRDRVADALGVNRSHDDVTNVLQAVENVHSHRCPNCEETIRATNVEWLYENGDVDGDIVHQSFVSMWANSYEVTDEKEQLYYCPNNECRIQRLFPSDD